MNSISLPVLPLCEIFCRVVDNFGDIGVCWRLARELAQNRGFAVRLWVDDWTAFVRLCPQAGAVRPGGAHHIAGVDIRWWTDPLPALEPGDLVIEAFACELPEIRLQAMARRQPAPVWINLEYLSAEDWVAGCHGLASPHPRLGLIKLFFFPGFDQCSGGLLRENGLLAARDAFVAGQQAQWWAEHGLADLPAQALRISLFAYERPGLSALLQLWAAAEDPVVLMVPEGRVLGDVARALGRSQLVRGDRVVQGRLTVVVLPFSDQPAYDRLLWACDLNFVRGEDSFVRAQWAAHPFVWQIYPQACGADADKLAAFLDRHTAGLDPDAARALQRFWTAWNAAGEACADGSALVAAWPAFAAALPTLAVHARRWCETLAAQPDLSTRLTEFFLQIRDRAG